jgi:hypothetical protein
VVAPRRRLVGQSGSDLGAGDQGPDGVVPLDDPVRRPRLRLEEPGPEVDSEVEVRSLREPGTDVEVFPSDKGNVMAPGPCGRAAAGPRNPERDRRTTNEGPASLLTGPSSKGQGQYGALCMAWMLVGFDVLLKVPGDVTTK